MIAAMAKNRVIGKGNGLPWKIPEDFKYFLSMTRGKIVITGRKNLEAMGGLMKNRPTIVVTRQTDLKVPGAHAVVNDPATAIAAARSLARDRGEDEVFILGGGELYRQTMELADRIYLTEINQDYEGDVTFPEIPGSLYREISRMPGKGADPLDFVVYERI